MIQQNIIHIKQNKIIQQQLRKTRSHTVNKVDYSTHQYKMMGLLWGVKCIQLCGKLLQLNCTQTIAAE